MHFRGNRPHNINYTKNEEQGKQWNSSAETADKYALGCLMVGEESSCNTRTKQLTENSNHQCVCVCVISIKSIDTHTIYVNSGFRNYLGPSTFMHFD